MHEKQLYTSQLESQRHGKVCRISFWVRSRAKKTIFANCVAYVRTFGYCARREILEWATTGRARVRTNDTQETDVYYAVAAQRVCHESRA